MPARENIYNCPPGCLQDSASKAQNIYKCPPGCLQDSASKAQNPKDNQISNSCKIQLLHNQISKFNSCKIQHLLISPSWMPSMAKPMRYPTLVPVECFSKSYGSMQTLPPLVRGPVPRLQLSSSTNSAASRTL